MAKRKQPDKTFEVSLPHHPTMRFECASGDDAWELFKAHFGIIDTDHQPVIVEPTEDDQSSKQVSDGDERPRPDQDDQEPGTVGD